ncbi:MAG: hypothetical protein ACM3H8_09015 [Sphingobacteriales bacterium]
MLFHDNHMDDLFRLAAENYPLKTGEGKWSDIAPLLIAASALSANDNKENNKSNNKGKYLLLMFLMAGYVSAVFILNPNKDTKVTSAASNTVTITDNNLKFINPVMQRIKSSGPANHISRPTNNKIISNKTDTLIHNQIKEFEKPKQTLAKIESIANNTPIIKVNKLTVVTSIPSNNKTSDLLKQPFIKNKKIKQNGFYAAITMGAGFNEVRSQKLTTPGLEGGIRFGYRFNKKISVETGLLIAKKYYHSDGKFFNTDKISGSMPAGMQMISLSSDNTVYQLPVKVKYNFISTGKGNIFTAAGISSYILTKEKNNYLALINGSRQSITSIYKEQRRYFAAVLDLSAGYELTFKKNKTIRLEPYLQAPLMGIGVGAMPVISTGLHISYSLYHH